MIDRKSMRLPNALVTVMPLLLWCSALSETLRVVYNIPAGKVDCQKGINLRTDTQPTYQ